MEENGSAKQAIQERIPERLRVHLRPLWKKWKHRPAFLRRTSIGRPIFVVGHPRSGTSWMYKLVVSHPSLAGGPETHLFDYYLSPFLGKDPFSPWGGLSQWVEEEEQTKKLRGFVDDVFAHRLAEEQKKRVVEKTPEHALFIREIKALYPDAKFIHIVRDGRDVMLSVFAYASNLKDAPESVEEAAQQWNRTLNAVEEMREKYPSDILMVRYEDLVSDPEKHMSQIFAFVGEPCSADAVQQIVNTYPPSAKSVGKWRRSLSVEDAEQFERTAQDWLRELNYELLSKKE